MTISNRKRFLFSDSLSSMQALNNGDTSNPLLIQVLEELTTLASLGFHIVFFWIPCHIGIKDNEKVDKFGSGGFVFAIFRFSPLHMQVYPVPVAALLGHPGW